MLPLRLVCLLIITVTLINDSECSNESSSGLPICPTWTYPSPPDNECVCGDKLHYNIVCDPDTLITVITGSNICVFFSRESLTTFAGTCPYGFRGTLPRNASEAELSGEGRRFCFHLHRRGQLCGECEVNYTLPVYSYYLGCVQCESYKNGWVKFVAAAFLPLTLFYIIVITFRISATTPPLNAFILVNQILAIPPVLREFYTYSYYLLDERLTSSNHSRYLHYYFYNFVVAVPAVWNLDFFRSFYGPTGICLYHGLTYQQVLLFEYAIGLYPLFLIVITYLLIKLHDHFAIVVWLWKPVHRCLAILRRQWNIRSYLIHALATFIVLSYVKILNTSFEFLRPSHVFNVRGQVVNKAYWFYNGSVDMTSKDYLPYVLLAGFMLLTFNALPLLLVALYPFKCVQKRLNNHLSLRCKVTLQIFMDAFHGCYEDTTHDYRHFATLYMAVRFFNLLAFAAFSAKLYVPAASIILVFASALVAKFQPYKCKRYNTFDIVILLAMITVYTSSSMHSMEAWLFPHLLNEIIFTGATLTIYGYLLFLLLSKHNIFLKAVQCFKKGKPFLLFSRFGKNKHNVINVEGEALLNHDHPDINISCDNH